MSPVMLLRFVCISQNDFIRERHNDLRLKHNADSLRWSTELEKAASAEAKLIKEISNCTVMLNQINTNYFSISPNSKIESAVDTWYEGIKNYDFELGPIRRGDDTVFQFTRVVWNSAEKIGCSSACCRNRGVLICKYDSQTNQPDITMGCIQNVHPKKYGQGSRQCRVCSNRHAIIRKYNINICRQCFRERADIIGFKKYR
ncbi:hypothetical protein C922_03005 [Plasmodium inui San Antonio 1]|nr:hypothetical protein C922_03005 [Plasmodium inui San Antonio 1]EUD66680.1 hypothetical protein C922_03005 [Plasmodium inui San Antonio 1]